MKPIVFNTEMVKAILAGRKTVTRRVVKLDLGLADIDKNDKNYIYVPDRDGDYHHITKFLPSQVGDILYVKETWCFGEDTCSIMFEPEPFPKDVLYKADFGYLENGVVKWKSSTHMPKEISRIFLKVTNVRVERLQDITEYEVFAEGLEWFNDRCSDENWKPSYHDPDSGGTPQMRKGFENLWNSTIKKKDLKRYGWDANPYVWVIEFERVNNYE